MPPPGTINKQAKEHKTMPGEYESTMPGALCDIYHNAPDIEELRAAFVDDGFAVQS